MAQICDGVKLLIHSCVRDHRIQHKTLLPHTHEQSSLKPVCYRSFCPAVRCLNHLKTADEKIFQKRPRRRKKRSDTQYRHENYRSGSLLWHKTILPSTNAQSPITNLKYNYIYSGGRCTDRPLTIDLRFIVGGNGKVLDRARMRNRQKLRKNE